MDPVTIELGAGRLSPTGVYVGKPILGGAAQISTPNSFACHGKGGFGYMHISKELEFRFEPVERGFPKSGGFVSATPDGRILWGKSGYRGLRVIDRDTRKTLEVTASICGSAEIGRGLWKPFSDKNHILVRLFSPARSHGLTRSTHVCYDMSTGEVVFYINNVDKPGGRLSRDYGKFIPTGNDGELIGANNGSSMYWDLFTVTDTGFGEIRQNELTRILNEYDFSLSYAGENIKEADMEKRYIFGESRFPKGVLPPLSRRFPAVVRWDENMEEVTVSMLTGHIPRGYRVSRGWAVSPNGEWARVGLGTTDFSNKIRYVCFFHLSDSYPLGVSPAVIGASTSMGHGVFVEHDELGTIYVDYPADGTPESVGKPVLVYRMSEFFDALKEQTAEMLD